MNVCICTSSFPLNHSEVFHRYLEDLIQVLIQNGHHVTILTQDKKGKKESVMRGVDVVWFPWQMTEKNVLAEVSFNDPKNFLSALSLIYNGTRYSNKIAKEKKIDIFLCLWIVPSGLYACLSRFLSGWRKTPYLLWSLGSDVYNNKDNFLTRKLLRFIIRRSKAVFADGFELCEIIEKISGKKCGLLPTFHRMEIDIQNNIRMEKNSVPSFLYIGRLSKVKGPDILIKALGILHSNQQIDFRCYIVGDGEMMEELVNEVKQSNLGSKVVFTGKIMDEKIKAGYMNLCDCVIIPSRSESIPVVLSEAVQYEKPMITSNAGDMETVVRKYNLGLVAKKEDAGDLADKIAQFIAQPLTISKEDQKRLIDTLLFEKNAEKLLSEI